MAVVGGRYGPNFTELLVLAPVSSLTTLEYACSAASMTGKRNGTILYRNILLTYGSIGRIRLVSLAISPFPLNGVLAIGALMRCFVTWMTVPLTGGI